MFLVNSRHGLFTATSSSSRRKPFTLMRHPFSLSYGVRLPSSLTGFLSITLGYSPRPRVSVCGTVSTDSRLEVFLGSMGSMTSITRRITRYGPQLSERIYLIASTPTTINRQPSACSPTLPRYSITQTNPCWCRNMNLLPIGYAFRLDLRGRLTPGGLALPGNPWAFGEGESHPLYRYLCRHSHL